ncbi:hypothetical protein FHS51_003273 [Sphingobium wenxiniae]|nr:MULTISPECIES: hypothetical protein [Sphingobium]MBB6193018.1 hypothetical protein [Sphingobium wenxiniae]WRD76375.1 hypothetical protein QQ987_16745 [Sphingobium baderi]
MKPFTFFQLLYRAHSRVPGRREKQSPNSKGPGGQRPLEPQEHPAMFSSVFARRMWKKDESSRRRPLGWRAYSDARLAGQATGGSRHFLPRKSGMVNNILGN